MPESVLEQAKKDLMNYGGCGMSVMEMTHRGKYFQDIFDNAKELFKNLLKVPDSHEILFLQGGATLQFAQIPMNLLCGGSADYAVTGNFSNKAAKEAKKYGSVSIAYTSEETGHDRIPSQAELKLSADAKYFYYCANNTIYGTEWQYVPQTGAPLVCDMSSDIMTREINVPDFGIIYAGAQKNMAPAGLTVVIVKKELAGNEMPCTPETMSYANMIKADSMLNTPPCWCIYMLSLMLEWVKEKGGVKAMDELKRQRSELIYSVLDNSSFYIPHAQKASRSFMNITFRTPNPELDAEFIREAEKRGLVNLKGHKITGGLRASLYNAMPLEGALELSNFMKEFEIRHV